MSDEIAGGSLDADLEAGQPSGATESQQPTYVTLEELEARITQAVSEAKRFSQSMVDKSSDRVTKALKEQEKALLDRVDTLRKAGYEVTDDIVAAQRKRIVESVLAGESDEVDDEDEPAQAGPPTDYRMQARVYASQGKVMAAIADAGFSVENNDPELRSIATNAKTPEEWEQSYLAALSRKGKRIGKPFEPAQVDQTPNTPAAARVPGGAGSSQGTGPGTLEAITSRLEQLYNDPVKNQKEITKLLADHERLLKQRR